METSLFLPTTRASQIIPSGPGLAQRGNPRSQGALSRHTAHIAKRRHPDASGPVTPPTRHCPAVPTPTPLEDGVRRRGALQGVGARVCQILGMDPRPAQAPAPPMSAQQVVLLLSRPGPPRAPQGVVAPRPLPCTQALPSKQVLPQ